MPEADSAGLALLGGASLGSAFSVAKSGSIETAIVLENDLFRRAPRDQVEAFFTSVRHATVLDCLENETTERAEVVLPTGTFAESSGTFVNNEARAQRFFRVLPAAAEIEESWSWLVALLRDD